MEARRTSYQIHHTYVRRLHIFRYMCHLWLEHDPQNSHFFSKPSAYKHTAFLHTHIRHKYHQHHHHHHLDDMCYTPYIYVFISWLWKHEYYGNYIKLQQTACNSYWFLLNLSTCFDHCLLFCMLMTSTTHKHKHTHTILILFLFFPSLFNINDTFTRKWPMCVSRFFVTEINKCFEIFYNKKNAMSRRQSWEIQDVELLSYIFYDRYHVEIRIRLMLFSFMR